MKVKFTFRHSEHLHRFEKYGADKMKRLEKYETKLSWANVVVSKLKHQWCVELKVVGKDLRIAAKAKADELHEALDRSMDKIAKQMSRKKQILQKHKHSKRTKEYALDHFTDPFLNVSYKNDHKKSA